MPETNKYLRGMNGKRRGSDDAAGGVEEGKAAGGAGDGGVEPAVEVEAEVCLGGDVAHIDKY